MAKALFLDRDGVINRRIVGSYVMDKKDFVFLPGVLECFHSLNEAFDYVFVVTNQQGIGKGLFTSEQLCQVHEYMLDEISAHGGHIDRVYYCPDLETSGSNNRKPKPGMALMAVHDYPMLKLEDCLMVGDSVSDLEFAKNAGMPCAFISGINPIPNDVYQFTSHVYSSLAQFSTLFFNTDTCVNGSNT